ncbi:MAG: putative ral secretion pathway protein GspD [Pseudomonadota bacterium]|jgi:general secretion pathway protein D
MTMNKRQANRSAPGWATRCVAGALSATLVLPSLSWAQSASARFKGGEPVTLNFVNADIDAVSRAMAAILKQQFVVDPRVKGNITLYSEQALTPREAYLNYLAALRGLGFTVVEVGGLFKVVPEADAKLQASTVAVGGTAIRGDQIITQIFKLNHENANNLVPVLRPLISPNNTINANPGNNSLVVTDYADNLGRIAKIIAAMDTPASGDVEIIPLKHAVASDIAALVQRLTDSSGGNAAGGAAAGNTVGLNTATVLADARSNSLMVRAPNPARLASIRALVTKLDKPVEGAGGAAGNIWVVYLKNADAVKLAAVIRAAYSATGSGSGGGTSGGASSNSMQNNAAAQTGNASGASTQSTSPVTASAAPSTGGFIQADPATNSLIITAPEPMYRQLRSMIDQLDSRRAQVYIESMIVEVSGSNAAEFGFQWQGLAGIGSSNNYGVFAGNSSTTAGPSIVALSQTIAGGTVTSPGEGLSIGLIKNYGGTYALAAIARTLQTQSDTNIVSTPNLITLDNEEAKIVVGENVPFITGQYTNTSSGTTNPFQTIERKDVGITLRIKPQIGENGSVRMTIFQESSSVQSTTAAGTTNAGPSTKKRSIESTVVVDDGQIIVLGGLIEDSFVDTKSKVPLLGDLPLVGALFRSESRTKKRTNLMVFLRPVVMRDADSANKLSLDRYDILRNQQKDTQPLPSIMMPINEAPVLPPMRRPEEGVTPAAAAPAASATAR